MVQIHFLFGHAFSSRLLLQWAKQCMTNQRVYATAHGAQHTHTLLNICEQNASESRERAKKRLSLLKVARHTLRIYIANILLILRQKGWFSAECWNWNGIRVEWHKSYMCLQRIVHTLARVTSMNHPIHWRTSDKKKTEKRIERKRSKRKNMMNTFYESGLNNAQIKQDL